MKYDQINGGPANACHDNDVVKQKETGARGLRL